MLLLLKQLIIVAFLSLILTGCKVDEVLKELFVSSEIIAVNTTDSTLSVDIDGDKLLLDTRDYSNRFCSYGNGCPVSYDGAESTGFEMNEKYLYYATDCPTVSGHVEHNVETHKVTIINLSNSEISPLTNNIVIAHGVVLSDILDTLPPCSVTPIDSLDNYSFSSELNVTLDGNIFNMGPFIFDYSILSHKSEVSLDIVIYPDYSLQLIPILSVASEYAISNTPSTTDNGDSDSDWDWD